MRLRTRWRDAPDLSLHHGECSLLASQLCDMQHFKSNAALWIVTHEMERSNPGLPCKIYLGQIFRNKSIVMVRAGIMDTLEAEFLSVVANCDHTVTRSHPDDTRHGQLLCNISTVSKDLTLIDFSYLSPAAGVSPCPYQARSQPWTINT